MTGNNMSYLANYIFCAMIYLFLFIYLFIQHFYSALFINKYALMRYAYNREYNYSNKFTVH